MEPGKVSNQQLSDLLAALYAAAEEPALWPGFLDPLADVVNGSYALIVSLDVRDAEGSVASHGRCDPAGVDLYSRYWGEHDVWVKRGPRAYRTEGGISASQSIVPDATVEASPFYQDFLRKQESFQNLTGTIRASKELASVLSIHYRKSAGHRRPEEFALMRLLTPHLQRAVDLHRRLRGGGRTEAALREAVNRLPTGFVLVDEDARIVWMNEEAELILARGDGLSVRDSRIVAREPDEGVEIAAMVGAACRTTLRKSLSAGGVVKVSRDSGKDPYQLTAMPVHAEGILSNDYRAAAVVLIADPEREVRTSPEALAEIYDFTVQESRVAAALLAGQTPREIGESLRLRDNTVRTHLKHVYSKADVRGQAELVRKLMRGLAEIASPRED